MAINEKDRLEIINLIEERVEPVRIQRVEFEEIKTAVRDLQIEVDLLGEARKGEEVRTVVAEAKGRVQMGEIESLIRRNRKIAAAKGGSFLWVLFPQHIHPRALERAREEGMLVIPWDYQYARH